MSEIDVKTLGALISAAGNARIYRNGDLRARDPGWHPENLGAGLAVAPTTTKEVSDILSFCNRAGVGVVPHGGLTGLAGGAASKNGQIIMMLTELRSTTVDPETGVAVVGAGATLESVDRAAALHGLAVGIDLAARGSATIGGMISTNAGGGEAFRNGTMRHRVLGLEVVLPDGSIMSDMKHVTKANEGVDVKHLFIGAEGTLGIVTRAVIKLEPRQVERSTVLVGCRAASGAVKAFATLNARKGIRLLLAEIMWADYACTAALELGLEKWLTFADCPVYVIFDLAAEGGADGDSDTLMEVLEAMMSSGAIEDAVIAKNESERSDIWRIREESDVIDRRHPHGLWFDLSVPQKHLDDYVAGMLARVSTVDSDFRVFVMGHLGDGNLHLTLSRGTPAADEYARVADAVYDGLGALGGSFSAEHGIGTEKKASMSRLVDPVKLEMMRSIKRLLDPNGIMNPGKIF